MIRPRRGYLMVDTVVSLLEVKAAKGKRGDAATLLKISRLIQQLEDAETRELLNNAWRKATISFFASSFGSLHG